MFAQQLGEELRNRGHEVRTVAFRSDGTGPGLGFMELPAGRFSPAVLHALTSHARWSQVVVSHGGSTLQSVAIASALARRPFAYRNIGDPSHWGAARLSRLRIGLPLRRATGVAALYDSAASYLVEHYGIHRGRISVLGNAVPAQDFPSATVEDRAAARARLGLAAGVPVIGYLGALAPEKRPSWMIDVAVRLDGVVVAVAGDGPLRAEMSRSAAGVAGSARLHVLEPPTDPATFLRAVDVLAVPSTTEGVPAVVLEAALTGTPVVATAVGGVTDTMRSLDFGRTVPRDDLEGFIDALRQVLARPGEFTADRARVVEAHDLGSVATRWESFLNGIVDQDR